MGKRLSLAEIILKLSVISPNIKVLGEYEKETGKTKKRMRRYIKCKCITDNYEWDSEISAILNGNNCPKCVGNVPLTLKLIKEKLKLINPNISILSKEYKNNSTKLKCKCLADKHIWYPCWNSLLSGRGCPICANKNTHEKQKLSLLEIKERLFIINPNIQILSKEYVNAHETLECKCLIHNNTWFPTWASLSQGGGCPICGVILRAENNKISIKEITEQMKKINPTIEILGEFQKEVGITDKRIVWFIKCHCLIDGHEWNAIWSELKQGQGCIECGYRNNSGENSYMWKGGITTIHNYLRGKITQWKKDSFKKYNYKCDITNMTSSILIIHHLYNFSNIVQETMDLIQIPIYNEINLYTDIELKLIEDKCLELHYKYGLGVSLSKEEHDLFHSIYTNKNNTKEQYIEFKEMRLKQINNKAI